MKRVQGIGFALVALALVSGCGGGGETAGAAVPEAPATTAAPPEPSATSEAVSPGAADPGDAGPDVTGTWRTIAETDLETLTITGDKVTTTGKLTCTGELARQDAKRVITLRCPGGEESRSTGQVKVKADGTALAVEWDSSTPWGGRIDSYRKAG
ncbi:hypothetical protein Misp01_61180 [Microtetraspora sp. NBRC 13810]|uniref:hypothetical protein n=1 Tax=Microtetraspora sp. NBRC 13810 TaxID=3030990 RepID=UPI0024A4FD61|nr:hypothetical protein [Microtetraspora sp. NBRC 13810]GLW10990.1 hypothetical protein Misp01_61180 [Microtetraspora sp. NBRC 13810]